MTAPPAIADERPPAAATPRPAALDPFDLRVERGADRRVTAAALVVGLAVDAALRSELVTFAGWLAVAAAATLLVATRPVRPAARAIALTAVLLALALPLRASPAAVMPAFLASLALVAVAASFARHGDPTDVTIPEALMRGVHAATHGIAAPAFLLRAAPARGGDGSSSADPDGASSGTAAAIGRGLLLAAPVCLVVGLLLASGDAVFASAFDGLPDLGEIPGHLILIAIGAWAFGALARLASAAPARLRPPPRATAVLGRVEASTVLGSLVALYSWFAVAQLVALSEGGRRVVETAGLTYADYARSGFFQLLAAATITVGTIVAVRAGAGLPPIGRGRRPVTTLLALALVALTLLAVVVAVRRLGLYTEAYGLTVARVVATVAAWWLGGALVMLGMWVAGVGAPRAWFLPATAALAVVVAAALAVADPEALVVRSAVDRAAATGDVDLAHLTELSPDGIVELDRHLDQVRRWSAPAADELVASLPCGRRSGDAGWAAWNRSARLADGVLDRRCPSDRRTPAG